MIDVRDLYFETYIQSCSNCSNVNFRWWDFNAPCCMLNNSLHMTCTDMPGTKVDCRKKYLTLFPRAVNQPALLSSFHLNFHSDTLGSVGDFKICANSLPHAFAYQPHKIQRLCIHCEVAADGIACTAFVHDAIVAFISQAG